MKHQPFTPHTMTHPPQFDDSITQYNLQPTDHQPHLTAAATPHSIIFHFTNFKNTTADQLRAEALTAAEAAIDRYQQLPDELKRQDQKIFQELETYLTRVANNHNN